ncbi:hypothetical protein J3Q64DRAFT_1217161 [Phycomyces blakesleeanus]|uniref:FAR1 domain-containing protein n=1 Tax=Phycomyces blakesleeanus TaxID=4837 RepID=A0ABR3BCH9_PHYBL
MNDLVILSDNSSRLSDEAVAEFNTLFIVGKEFPSTVAVREAAKAYGIKHNIAFTTHSATANRIKMICKHAGEYRDTRKAEKEAVQASGKEDTPLPGKERVRRKKSRKCGCQCFVYAAVDRHGRLAVRSREAEHNHTIEEDRKAYAMHRKLTPEALSLVNKHLENNDNAPTIFRILQENGFTNIILRDIENIKQNFAKKDTIKELSTLISALHNLDFFVRLTVPEIETDTDTNIGIGTSANANASTGKWRASPHTVFLIHKNDIEEYDKHLLKAKIFTLIDNVHQPKTEGDIYEQIMAYNVFIQNYCESKGIIAKPFAEEGRVDKKNWLSLYSYKFPYIVSDTYNRYESIHTSLQVDKTFNNPDDNNNDDASDIIVEYDNEDHSDVITAQEPESTRSFSESACIIVRKLTKLFELYVTDTTQQEQDNIQQSIDNLIQAIETSKHNKSSSSTNNLSKRHNRSPKRKLSEVENRLDEILKAPKLPKNTNNTKTGRKKAK